MKKTLQELIDECIVIVTKKLMYGVGDSNIKTTIKRVIRVQITEDERSNIFKEAYTRISKHFKEYIL